MRCSTAARSTSPRAAVPFAPFAAAATYCLLVAGCAGRERPPRAGDERLDGEAPACPRDAAEGPSGRCACESGTVQALGACVEPNLADAFCAPARMTEEGCSFRGCGDLQAVDVATGACVSGSALAAAGALCPEGTIPVPASSRLVCLPRGAACPRGTVRAAAGEGRTACVRAPRCPPGSLGDRTDRTACKPVVFSRRGGGTDPFTGRLAVDLGAWAVRAIGIDGGPGSAELCRPLEMRPDLFTAGTGRAPVPVDVSVTISVPDEDVTQVHASVVARGPEPLRAEAQGAVRAAVGSLVELLRSLGGESTAASTTLRVRCTIGSAAAPPDR